VPCNFKYSGSAGVIFAVLVSTTSGATAFQNQLRRLSRTAFVILALCLRPQSAQRRRFKQRRRHFRRRLQRTRLAQAAPALPIRSRRFSMLRPTLLARSATETSSRQSFSFDSSARARHNKRRRTTDCATSASPNAPGGIYWAISTTPISTVKNARFLGAGEAHTTRLCRNRVGTEEVLSMREMFSRLYKLSPCGWPQLMLDAESALRGDNKRLSAKARAREIGVGECSQASTQHVINWPFLKMTRHSAIVTEGFGDNGTVLDSEPTTDPNSINENIPATILFKILTSVAQGRLRRLAWSTTPYGKSRT